MKQANIANTQQVNNGTQAGPPAGQSTGLHPDLQLEHLHGEYLELGKATAEIRIDPASQTLAKIHRLKNT